MKTAEQICNFVASRIGHIYYRPLMYGGSPSGVDLILHDNHELWAEAMDLRECFTEISYTIHIEQDCGSADFSTHYSKLYPTASREEVCGYVVQQWKKISDHLQIPIPYDEIAHIFRDYPNILQYARKIGILLDE